MEQLANEIGALAVDEGVETVVGSFSGKVVFAMDVPEDMAVMQAKPHLGFLGTLDASLSEWRNVGRQPAERVFTPLGRLFGRNGQE